jgi:ABC-type transport system substrate-binding protein/class 3 adenylate cyclase
MPDWPAQTVPSSVTFADLLRHHRVAAGFTQEELAERAGLSVDAISTLERGARRRPRKETVALLGDALALPAEERAAFVAARRASATSLAATPPGDTAAALNGHVSSDGTLPHGVVAFVFADVEGSARLLHQLGSNRYADVLAEAQTVLRTVWTTHAGHELGTQGDRFFAVFASADDALAAAAAAQQALAEHSWPDSVQVRLCMGLHVGPALLTAGRYVGLEVHRAARIAAAGHGGQVVVSGALADQVAKFGYDLPDGTHLRSLGKHRLQDLPHREQLYELELPALPGLPAAFPRLRTLDAWPGLRADLTVVVGMSAVLLAVVGLLLPLVVPTFPWAIGVGSAVLAVLVLAAAALAQPVRRALTSQWRDARKPVAAVTSALLSLVVVVTTLFAIVLQPVRAGQYDFSYTYHRPPRSAIGGSVVLGTRLPNDTLAPPGLTGPTGLYYEGLWQSCIVQLPELGLGLDAWKADQCAEVPTVDNGEEDPLGKWTTFHIDQRAVWSDGQPITADDFLFAFKLYKDPKVHACCSGPPTDLMTLTKLDQHTVQIDWSEPYAWYLDALWLLNPVPLHVYATGPFTGVYNPTTGAINSTLARQLVALPSFTTTIPVDNGPFTVQNVFPFSPAPLPVNTIQMDYHSLSRVVLARNPHFFSNAFPHPPALDQVTVLSFASNAAQGSHGIADEDATIASYRKGDLTLTDALETLQLRQLEDMPKSEVIVSPQDAFLAIAFNERDVAPNAQANGGHTMFADRSVRQAFVEAFDRCAAVRTQLSVRNCTDPNLRTDEYTAPPDPAYDPTMRLPAYNPNDAAHLLERAGYPVVAGVRRGKDGVTPLEVRIILAGSGVDNQDIALAMQHDYATNLQIRATIVPKSSTNIFAHYDEGGVAALGAFDIALYSDGGPPDLWEQGTFSDSDSASIPSAQNSDGSNFWGIVDPWMVSRVQLANQETDSSQRVRILQSLYRYATQQVYLEPVYVEADVALVKPTLCNYKKWPGSAGLGAGYNTWNMADWYVARGPTCP